MTRDVTVCMTYFKSLSLANFAAALYSVRQQSLECVRELIIVDNDTVDATAEIADVVDSLSFPIPVRTTSYKHGDATRTHPWSVNAAVRQASTPWVFFTRADYLLDFDALRQFVSVAKAYPDWDGFVTANVYHLTSDVGVCEATTWRAQGPSILLQLPGAEGDYTKIDAGVWLMRRATFDAVGGLEEKLVSWGHAQTHFQYKLHKAGVEFIRIPRAMFYHPQHSAARDINLAYDELVQHGIDLREMWARYEGVSPY